MTRVIARAGVGIVLCFLLLFPSLANGQVSFKRIITFGDSLSDPGNYFLLTGDFLVRPFTDYVPDSPYLIGRFHFSNGPTWVEQLANDLCMPGSGKPALLFPRVFTNYAVGRSTARPPASQQTATCKLCDLTSQVNRFLQRDFPHGAPPDALYVVFIGANDLFDAILTVDPSLPDLTQAIAIITEAVTVTSDNISELYGAGARTFLVGNMPNVALTPVVKLQGTSAEFLSGLLSDTYNGILDAYLTGLKAGLPGIKIVRLDVSKLLGAVVLDPESAGFSDVEHSCVKLGVVQGAICAHPDQYLFWDGIHPTTAGHDVLTGGAKEALATAP